MAKLRVRGKSNNGHGHRRVRGLVGYGLVIS
jgi:hypothetical protein